MQRDPSLLLALLLGALASVASYVVTGVAREYALRKAILDIPTNRSAHQAPTPRGGGLAIVLVVCAGLTGAALLRWVTLREALGLGGGGALVAAIGWLDDRRGTGPGPRAVVHLVAAAWMVYWVGGLADLSLGAYRVPLGWVGVALAVVGVAWMINLYNFMDGIDGLAASEAVAAGLIAIALLWLGGARGLAVLALLVACGSAGFLAWNWAPAKIFMGDVGSGFLGFMFAGLALASESSGTLPATVLVLILGVFVFDATVTLVRRMLHGERWYAAHNKHAYQRAVQAGWSHGRVNRTVLGLNLALGALAGISVARPPLLPACLTAGTGMLALAYGWVERRRPMYPSDTDLQ